MVTLAKKLILLFVMLPNLGCTLAWYHFLQEQDREIKEYSQNFQELNRDKLFYWGIESHQQNEGKLIHNFQFPSSLKNENSCITISIADEDIEDGIKKTKVIESDTQSSGNPSAILLIHTPQSYSKKYSELWHSDYGKDYFQEFPNWFFISTAKSIYWDVYLGTESQTGSFMHIVEKLGLFSSESPLETIVVRKNYEWILKNPRTSKQYLLRKIEGSDDIAIYAWLPNFTNISAIFYMDIDDDDPSLKNISLIYRFPYHNSLAWYQYQSQLNLTWQYRSKFKRFGKRMLWYVNHAGLVILPPFDIPIGFILLPYVIAGTMPGEGT